MKKMLLSAAAIALLAFLPASRALAQDSDNADQEKSKDKISEYDEIIIKQKEPGKDGKVTVEIKDGKVTVNGKPIDEYDNEDLSVQRRNSRHFKLMSPSPFRNGGAWNMDDGDKLYFHNNSAFLGVSTEDAANGARIEAVSPNSAAEKAGLKKGDVIIKVNDKTIDKASTLTDVIGTYKPEEKITITYKRDGKEQKASATLGEREVMMYGGKNMLAPGVPGLQKLREFRNFNFDFNDGGNGNIFLYGGKPRLGIKAQDTEDGKGVKVLDVDDDSPAGKAGIKEDDIITSFEGKTVNSADELAAASRDAKDKSTLKVGITRNGESQTIEIKIPKKLKTATL